jgi:hypothetical protein
VTDTLPIEEVDEPIRTVKLAEIRGAVRPKVYPIGRYRRRSYDHLGPATARCHHRRHRAPAVTCTCGFHAVRSVDDLPMVTKVLAASVVLDVELSGTVIEHERGYRAEHQSVLGIRFPSRCSRCGGTASHVLRGRLWKSACDRCAASARHGRAMRRADATAWLGVDVDFAPMPKEPRRLRALGVVRSIGMVLVAMVPLLFLEGVERSFATRATLVAGFVVSAALCGVTMLARSSRSHRALFLGQCAGVVAVSMVLRSITL